MKKTFNYTVWALFAVACELFLVGILKTDYLFNIAVLSNFALSIAGFINYKLLMQAKIFGFRVERELRHLAITENPMEKISFGLLLGIVLSLANLNLLAEVSFYKLWFNATMIIIFSWFGINYLRVLWVKALNPHSLASRERLYGK